MQLFGKIIIKVHLICLERKSTTKKEREKKNASKKWSVAETRNKKSADIKKNEIRRIQKHHVPNKKTLFDL